MATKYKRRQLLVNPGFQYRLLLRTTFYFVVYALCVSHIGFLLHVAVEVAKNGVQQPFWDFYIGYLKGQSALLVALVVTIPLVVWDLLAFSNRIAGPLYRCRKFILEMAGGKTVREFKPRKYDLMPEFFEAFNLLIKHCNAQVDGVGASSTGGTPVVLDGAPEATPEGDDLAALPRSGV